MTRDYVKRSNAYRGRRQNQSHAGLWLFTIALFILFTLGLVYLGQYHQHASLRAMKVSGGKGLTRNLAMEQTLPIKEEKNEANENKNENKNKKMAVSCLLTSGRIIIMLRHNLNSLHRKP